MLHRPKGAAKHAHAPNNRALDHAIALARSATDSLRGWTACDPKEHEVTSVIPTTTCVAYTCIGQSAGGQPLSPQKRGTKAAGPVVTERSAGAVPGRHFQQRLPITG